MKVFIVNGSPHIDGNTAVAIRDLQEVFAEESVNTEVMHIGGKDVRGLPFRVAIRQLQF